jgi:Lrp/AsnC family leucine-responsive transcriptional regulator
VFSSDPNALTNYAEKKLGALVSLKPTAQRDDMDMDEIDYRILRELQFNARITNAELAERVGLSSSPCWTRLHNLEKRGIIAKYVTVFDQSTFGSGDTAVIDVRLKQRSTGVIQGFEQALEALPEVFEAYRVSGECDYVIKVAVDGIAGYEEFVRSKLDTISGIECIRTSFVLRCLKRTFTGQPSLRTATERVVHRLRPASVPQYEYRRALSGCSKQAASS